MIYRSFAELLVEYRLDLRVIDIGLVIPIEAGIDEFREFLALESFDCIFDGLVTDADRVLGDGTCHLA